MKYVAHIIRILFLALFLFILVNGKVFLWLGLFLVTLIASLIFGRIYCGYICPMNTLMIPVEWLSKKLKIQKENGPKWLKNGFFQWITLAISIGAMILGKKFFHMNLPVLPFWLVISILVTLRYKPEVFHNLLCPFGALQKAFGRFAFFRKNVDKDSCIGCKLCEKVCPSNAILVSKEDKKATINTALCHQCTNCSLICPENAICYNRPSKK